MTVKHTDQGTKEPIPDLSRGGPRHLGEGDFTDSRVDLGPTGQPDFFPNGAFTPDVTVNA